MRIIQLSIAIIALTGIGLFACFSSKGESKNAEPVLSPAEGGTAITLPPFTLVDINGKTVDLASFKGKKVFVNLWATWCPPCRAEIPSIEKLYSRVNQERSVFIMLSLDKSFDLAKQYAQRNQMKLPVYYPAENLPALFSTDGIPATFIFNEKGKLIKRIDGADDYNTAEYLALFK